MPQPQLAPVLPATKPGAPVPAARTARLERPVPVFEAGRHRPGEPFYTLADLDRMVANFHANKHLVRPLAVRGELADLFALGPGHSWRPGRRPAFLGTDVGFPRQDGGPNYGRLTDLFRHGRWLYAEVEGVPEDFAALINAGRYFGVSGEVYDEPPPGCSGHGRMLKRVAWLGADQPQIKTLVGAAGLPLAVYSEAGPRPQLRLAYVSDLLPGGFRRCYSEVTPVANAALTEAVSALLAEKYPDLPSDFLDSLKPDQIALLAPGAADKPADAATPPAAGAQAMADPTPDQMRQELVAAGVLTQEEAAQMPDDALAVKYAEWKQSQTGGTNQMSEPVKTPPVTTPAAPAVPAALARQFSEVQAALPVLRGEVRSAQETIRRMQEESARRAEAERVRTVDALMDGWRNHRDESGRPAPKVLPQEAAKDSKRPNLYQRLLAASAQTVRTYAEGGALSDFDALVQEVNDRPGFARLFAEQLPGGGNARHDDPDLARAEADAKAFAERRNKHQQKKGA